MSPCEGCGSMSIDDHLRRTPVPETEERGRAKGLERAKVAGSEGRQLGFPRPKMAAKPHQSQGGEKEG